MKSNSLLLSDLVIAREGAVLAGPISMRLAAGELLILQGANGSGKSTLLKTIARLLPQAAGTIDWNGAPLGRAAARSAPIFYLDHKRGLSPSMSVWDNVSFWAKASGTPELAPAAMHYFDLSEIADVALSTLSAGWQQRVALSRLITIPSPLWLLDEPTANLDADGMALLHSLMQSRLEQGGIVLMSTHAQIQGDGIKTINLNTLSDDFKVIQ
jgi:heme exporter protein A